IAALGLGVAGLLLGLAGAGGGHGPVREVVVAARTLPAGRAIPPDALRLVAIAAGDSTPSMATALSAVAYRRPQVPLRAGDYVLESALESGAAAALGPGERAVPLRVDLAAAPPRTLLRAHARVDVVATRPAATGAGGRTGVIASGLELLGPARQVDDALVV